MAEATVIGATGKTGRLLVARLLSQGHQVIAVGRDAGRLAGLSGARTRVADLEDPSALRAALEGGTIVIGCAHARFIPAILAAAPETLTRLVLLGSTRKFSRIPDAGAQAVRRGEAAFLDSGLPGVILHPTMIYGAEGENNVGRMIAAVGAFPVLPLPGGGRALVQPIHVDDVVEAIVAAATLPGAPGAPIVIAGPTPMAVADMVRACARAVGRRVVIVPVPAGLAVAAARLTALLPERLRVSPDEVRRLAEDKAFDTEGMRARLGVSPVDFETGLARSLRRP